MNMQMIPTDTYRDNSQQTMSSLEIAELTGKRHDNVMRDIEKMLDKLGIAHLKFEATYIDQQGKENRCFELPPREVKILITGYDVVRRAKVIDRLELLEQQVTLPRTFSEALQLAANQAKMLEEQAPMVELANAFLDKGQDVCLRDAGKAIGFGKNWFEFLRENRIIQRKAYHPSRNNRQHEVNVANGAVVDAGYMEVRFEPDLNGVLRPQTFVTPKGMDWLRKLVAVKKAA